MASVPTQCTPNIRAPRSRQRHLRYVVSFEYDYQPALTHTGQVLASIPATGVRMAVKEATAALHPARWRSLVCVLDSTPSTLNTRKEL